MAEAENDGAQAPSPSSEVLSVPARAELVRFAVVWEEEEHQPLNADLSCAGFSADGKLVEFIGFDKPVGVQGSVKYVKEEGNSEILEICPSRVLHECEVLCIVLSAAESTVRQMDLGMASNLKLNIYSSERNKPMEQFSTVDLSEPTSTIVPTPNKYSDGHQSMLVCMLYRVGNGWHINCLLKTYPMPFWGDIIPEIRDTMKTLPDLEHAEEMCISENERVVRSRVGEERALPEASYLRERFCTSDGGNSIPDVKVVKIDVGWEVTDPEAEDVAVEFNCPMLSLDGEEVQAVSIDNPEGEGARVEEKQEEPEPEAAEAEAEEGEEEAGEEGGKEEEEEPPATVPAAEEPPVRASVFLTLGELPSNIRSIIITFSNLAGAGLAKVKTIYVRIQDVTDATQPRDCSVYTFTGSKTVAGRTGLVALKLLKEQHDSAYWSWKKSGFRTIEGFIGRPDLKNVMSEVLQGKKEFAAKLAAATAAEEGGEEDVKMPAVDFEWRVQIPGVPIPGESADDHLPFIKELGASEGFQTPEWKRCDRWCKVAFPNGDSYFGGYVDGKKSGLGWYVFANGGSYAGSYFEGKRQGKGMIMMPDSGCYSGEFLADKFNGQGAYFYPDGSCYIGGWESGLKEGDGVYWDKDGGCLRGNWRKGVLKGEAAFDQAAYNFQGSFVKGIPAGECTFTICADRTLHLPHTAMAHILSENGPTLKTKGAYNIPPGAADEVPEGEEPPDDAVQMPKAPNYEGLSFSASNDFPEPTQDIVFPPQEASTPPPLCV